MKRPLLYTEDKGHRFAIAAVQHASLDAAHAEAARSSMDCSHTIVWDCTDSPVGREVARYVHGQRVVVAS